MGIICYIYRMRKIFIGVLVIAILYFGYRYFTKNIVPNKKTKNIPLTESAFIPPTAGPPTSPRLRGTSQRGKEKKSIFVPDWSLTDDTIIDNSYDRWIYFGEQEKMSQFTQNLKGKELWYTEKVNTVNELTSLRVNEFEANNFKGVVLDLEISELPTEKLKDEINTGVYEFYKAAKQEKLQVALALYGDLFYRVRPYDLSVLKDYCDEVMVMAYDFHKSRGEPGPNFPYNGRDIYGYDFKMMVDDYLKYIPPEKLTVVFGMYGYDWLVDEQKKPIKPAQAVTLKEIKKNFINKCSWNNCVIKRDSVSAEREIDYIYSVIKNSEGYMDMHIIWSEDERSVATKSAYLKEKGIGSVGYWAYGYF